jgi:hypothetical protein
MSNETLSGCDPEWCIAVFARNEEARIGECLIAIARATDGVSTQVILLINGSSDKTAERALGLLPALGLRASVYKIGLGCKSHAMNVFVHDLRPRANVYFFVDATSFVEPNALRALAGALDRQPDIAAVSGLPINGRGAAQMRRGAMQSSKLFGQMFAVRQSCLDDLSTRGRRLPIGLYRCDGLFVGFICWETDGVAHERAMPRIATVPEAEWRIRPISWFGCKDIKAGFNRLVRQGRGRLENQSWNPILWTQGFGALPRFADDMSWNGSRPIAPEGNRCRIGSSRGWHCDASGAGAGRMRLRCCRTRFCSVCQWRLVERPACLAVSLVGRRYCTDRCSCIAGRGTDASARRGRSGMESCGISPQGGCVRALGAAPFRQTGAPAAGAYGLTGAIAIARHPVATLPAACSTRQRYALRQTLIEIKYQNIGWKARPTNAPLLRNTASPLCKASDRPTIHWSSGYGRAFLAIRRSIRRVDPANSRKITIPG